jgi:hypothetical protein
MDHRYRPKAFQVLVSRLQSTTHDALSGGLQRLNRHDTHKMPMTVFTKASFFSSSTPNSLTHLSPRSLSRLITSSRWCIVSAHWTSFRHSTPTRAFFATLVFAKAANRFPAGEILFKLDIPCRLLQTKCPSDLAQSILPTHKRSQQH